MRILIVGGGGREHALAWKLAQEAIVHVTPGNAGIADALPTHGVSTTDTAGLIDLVRRESIDLVVVGPEDPLIAGLADALRGAGTLVFGPGAVGAQLEGSKAFAKELMQAAGVPTAAHATFSESAAAQDWVRSRFAAGRAVAVKASGAALGKGVVVAGSEAEAMEAVAMMMDRAELGEAGRTVVIEDRLTGPEFSLLTLVNESGILSLPVAQDYKRIGDGDTGPNTGGMGSLSPVPWLAPGLVEQAEEEVVRRLLPVLARRGIPFRGVLFSGLLVHEGVPHALEYNVRFGDPETQTVMRRLGPGFAEALRATAAGEPIPRVEVLDHAAVTVVLAAAGYPGPVERGTPISIGPLPEAVQIFHAGTKRDADGQLVTNGGRVLAVSAVDPTMAEARVLAYQGAEQVTFAGQQMRADIGA